MNISLRRLGGLAAATVAATIAATMPARALGLSLGGTSLLHVQDCRSVALARQAAYGFDFSSKSTGPQHVEAGVVVDGTLKVCYSLDVASISSVDVSTWTDATLDAVVANLLGEADASKVCSAIRLVVGPGVHGTVSAESHAHVSVNGQPPVQWDHVFAKDVVVNNVGEDIVLKACIATAGNVSPS